MVAYQLPTGKTIFIDSVDLLFMTAIDEQKLIADDLGFFVNNPFYKSTLYEENETVIEELTIDEIENLDKEVDYDI